MATIYGDFQGFATSEAEMYPISYSGSGLFNMSPLAEDMMELLPSYYFLGNNNRRILELIATVLRESQLGVESVRDQFFVETATWGLIYWEQLVGLPPDPNNLDFETRRNAILAKLRDCSSEECFVDGLSELVAGTAIVTLLNPVTNPYQIDIELRSDRLVYNGPQSAPTASVLGSGPLTGDYTYKVTYEFPTLSIPSYIGVIPTNTGETSSGVTPIRTNEVQTITAVGTNEEQTLEISGTGTFEITFDGDETAAGLTETSTGTDVVNAINSLSPTGTNTYGSFSVSTSTPTAQVNDPGGVTIIFDGGGVRYVDLPLLQVTSATGTISDTVTETVTGSTVTDGSFTISFDSVWDTNAPPHIETTAPLPWNATRQQIESALESLPNVQAGTIRVTGGALPTPGAPIVIEWEGAESGFPQRVITINSTNLVGGTYVPARDTQGNTTYADSESNTVTASGNSVLLSNVPVSPDGAIRRNIYRKKNAAPYNEYRYVGSIEDNVTTVFTDDVDDVDLSEVQSVTVTGSGDFFLNFDSAYTSALQATDTNATVTTELNALSTVSYPDVEVTVTGTDLQTGLTIAFNQGDVVGKDVPEIVVVPDTGASITSTVETLGPRRLTEENTAFTTTFQRALQYIFNTKPAHLRVRELRSAGFRASINRAGDPV